MPTGSNYLVTTPEGVRICNVNDNPYSLGRWCAFLAFSAALFCIALLLACVAEKRPAWRADFLKRNPSLSSGFELRQVYLPQAGIADRCITCHLPDEVRNANDVHSVHRFSQFGCTVCHPGDGRSLPFDTAHNASGRMRELATDDLLSSARASCTVCHYQTYVQKEFSGPDEGRALAARLGCAECHVVPRMSDTNERLDLLSLVIKLRKNYLYSLLMQPKPLVTITRTMPYFGFNRQETADLTAYLSELPVYREIPLFSNGIFTFDPEDIERGQTEFSRLGCQKCHVTANFTDGGDDGSVLTNLGHRVDRRWLVWWINTPRDLRPFSQMPVYHLEDHSVRILVAYLTATTASDPYKVSLPQGNVDKGLGLFDTNHCLACHTTDGSSIERKIGPSLAGIAARSVTRMPLRDMPLDSTRSLSAFTRLDDYLADVRSYEPDVNRYIAMPAFMLPEKERLPLVLFLLSQRGIRGEELFRSSEPYRKSVDRGDILFTRRYCFRCHSLDSFAEGLTREEGVAKAARQVGPNLARIGGKVRAGWFEDWLMHPHSVLFRANMPDPMLTPQQAADLSAFLRTFEVRPTYEALLLLRSTALPPRSASSIREGEDLFVGKGCYKCHVIDGSGVHFGPDLSNVGEKITPGFLVRWLYRAGDIQPDTGMDDFFLPAGDALAIYRFLESRQERP